MTFSSSLRPGRNGSIFASSSPMHRRRVAGFPADEGFTIIELLVVLLIMGILMAIAVPMFSSTGAYADDSSAQSDLANAMMAVDSYYLSNQTFCNTNTTTTTTNTNSSYLASYLEGIEQEFTWVSNGTQASAASNQVGYLTYAETGSSSGSCSSSPPPQGVIAVYTESSTGVCWLMADNATGSYDVWAWGTPAGISYGYYYPIPSGQTCANGNTAWPNDPGGWQQTWPRPPAGK